MPKYIHSQRFTPNGFLVHYRRFTKLLIKSPVDKCDKCVTTDTILDIRLVHVLVKHFSSVLVSRFAGQGKCNQIWCEMLLTVQNGLKIVFLNAKNTD